jgi:hypothetical protein
MAVVNIRYQSPIINHQSIAAIDNPSIANRQSVDRQSSIRRSALANRQSVDRHSAIANRQFVSALAPS